MATILLTYEFGAGLGHLSPLMTIARKLSPRHRLVFHVPDMEAARNPVAHDFGDRAELLPMERWKAIEGPALHHTLADIFWTAGLGDPEQASAKAEAWRRTLGEIRPDLILADFAPGLRLAAGGPPVIEVGYGFTVPPGGRPLPPLRPWVKEAPPESRARELELLAVANRVRGDLGAPAIQHLAELFRGDETFLCTLPAFDMYAAYRSEPHLGPIMARVPMGPAPAQRRGPEVFAYMHANHPRLRELLSALTATGRRAMVYVSGAPAEQVARLCGRNVAISRRPVDFAQVLPATRLSIHHGGLGSSHAGLSAGTPQLMFPRRVEWQVNARGVVQLGGGRSEKAEPSGDPQALADLITSLVDDAALQDAALKASASLQEIFRSDTAQIIADACEARLGGA